jgi:hypothetical protein
MICPDNCYTRFYHPFVNRDDNWFFLSMTQIFFVPYQHNKFVDLKMQSFTPAWISSAGIWSAPGDLLLSLISPLNFLFSSTPHLSFLSLSLRSLGLNGSTLAMFYDPTVSNPVRSDTVPRSLFQTLVPTLLIEVSSLLFSVSPSECRKSTLQIRTRPLPTKSFPIHHHSLITLSSTL